jgi:hypothetical protein
MVFYQTTNTNLGKFWSVLQSKMLVSLMFIWYILRPFRIFNGHWLYLVVSLVYFSRFGVLHQEKSGDPVVNANQGDQ